MLVMFAFRPSGSARSSALFLPLPLSIGASSLPLHPSCPSGSNRNLGCIMSTPLLFLFLSLTGSSASALGVFLIYLHTLLLFLELKALESGEGSIFNIL